MNSRRFMPNIGLPPPRHIPPGVANSRARVPTVFDARSACHRVAGKSLGADLNCLPLARLNPQGKAPLPPSHRLFL
jgi:hypothetical protein